MPLSGAKVQILQMYSQDIISLGAFPLTGRVLADQPGTARHPRDNGSAAMVFVSQFRWSAITAANAQAVWTAIFAGGSRHPSRPCISQGRKQRRARAVREELLRRPKLRMNKQHLSCDVRG